MPREGILGWMSWCLVMIMDCHRVRFDGIEIVGDELMMDRCVVATYGLETSDWYRSRSG